MEKKKEKNNPMMFGLFVNYISTSLMAITLGGILIAASYELPLFHGIGQDQDKENNAKLVYYSFLVFGSIFIVAGALLAWIALDLGIILWGSQKAKEGRFICWYHKFVFQQWQTLVTDGLSTNSSSSSSNKSC